MLAVRTIALRRTRKDKRITGTNPSRRAQKAGGDSQQDSVIHKHAYVVEVIMMVEASALFGTLRGRPPDLFDSASEGEAPSHLHG